VSSVSIPNRQAFRAQEVCEIASVQPYVLRGWEAEFPDLGVAKTPSSPRVYSRADVARVLRLKHLIQVEGLTLAGARRRLEEEAVPDDLPEETETPVGPAPTRVEAPIAGPVLDDAARAHLREARQGLQWILERLDGNGAGEFSLAPATPPVTRSGKRKKAGK